jgi:threonine dehydrogenase-like Zn-dependent dehydrogenase
MILSLRGGDVYGLDVVDSTSARPKWLSGIGGHYVDGRQIPADKVRSKIGSMDLILDASGIAKLEFNLLDALSLSGVDVLTGIPGGDGPLQIAGAELVRQLVLGNQVLLGSVNAARGHFQMAADDLAQAHRHWPGHVQGLITDRHPAGRFAESVDTIKLIRSRKWSSGEQQHRTRDLNPSNPIKANQWLISYAIFHRQENRLHISGSISSVAVMRHSHCAPIGSHR